MHAFNYKEPSLVGEVCRMNTHLLYPNPIQNVEQVDTDGMSLSGALPYWFSARVRDFTLGLLPYLSLD